MMRKKWFYGSDFLKKGAMKTSLTTMSALLILSLSGCAQWGWTPKADAQELPPAKPAKTTPKESVPAHPIAFARYPQVDANQATGRGLNPGLCNHVAFFGETDYCAPAPRLAGETMTTTLTKSTWILPQTPLSFFWQQYIKDGQKLVVELVDSDGLPWPTTATLAREKNLYTIKVAPSHALLGAREMFLVGTVYDVDGKRTETWLEGFSVQEGTKEETPWTKVNAPALAKPKAAPKAKAAPKKKSKKRRR
jgi:hypothetical protein